MRARRAIRRVLRGQHRGLSIIRYAEYHRMYRIYVREMLKDIARELARQVMVKMRPFIETELLMEMD